MYGNGCAGSTDSGVSTGKMLLVELRLEERARSSSVQLDPSARSGSAPCRAPAGARRGRTPVDRAAGSSCARGRGSPRAARRASCRRGSSADRRRPRPAPGGRTPEPGRTRRGCCEKIARNFTPLEQRERGVLGEREHAGVEVEPRQLTVEVPGSRFGEHGHQGRRHGVRAQLIRTRRVRVPLHRRDTRGGPQPAVRSLRAWGRPGGPIRPLQAAPDAVPCRRTHRGHRDPSGRKGNP